MFALDTNTLVYLFKGAGRVGERLLAEAPADIAIPAVVLYELELGIALSSQPAKRRKQLDVLLGAVTVLPFEEASAKSAAHVESTLRSAGTPIGPRDVLIAGTALAHRATLVTHNVREFRRVRGLSVTDWF
jgi:tRNA(fMet)-specific endonuclease VapC